MAFRQQAPAHTYVSIANYVILHNQRSALGGSRDRPVNFDPARAEVFRSDLFVVVSVLSLQCMLM